ncbi:MAG: hypothetical protein RBT46_07970 [Weeksellaceae bacterium]|jgi:hypothetical protein|nr:hypothetical protein [Weeksellaceae bacterium]MDX9705626.1 hypothetical protein [Weeksellaceae bacterium]
MTNNIENNKDLDDLQSLWQSQKEEKTYGTDEIFKMIHRKSINSVQWLFIITLIEFLFGLGMSLWMIFTGSHLGTDTQMETVGSENYIRLEKLSHIGVLGSVIIVSITYYFYRKISSTLSVKDLIQNIIRFRKSIIVFIVLWMIFIFLLFVPILVDMGMNAYLNNEKIQTDLSPEANLEMAKKVGYITAAITMGAILIFSIFYYVVIYGIFLRRLGRNLKELRNMDLEN